MSHPAGTGGGGDGGGGHPGVLSKTCWEEGLRGANLRGALKCGRVVPITSRCTTECSRAQSEYYYYYPDFKQNCQIKWGEDHGTQSKEKLNVGEKKLE